MEILKIFSYLAYPSKHNDEQPEIGGAQVGHKGKLFDMLKEIFDKAENECHIPICFDPAESGQQQNNCRDELVAFIESPTLPNGRTIAERLQKVTTGKSGMGLFFIMLGTDGDTKKIVLSRFPAEQGIMAEQNAKSLTVEFVEQVFLKNAHSYKSALYKGKSTKGNFWKGFAVDKQTNHGIREVADYWIQDFLLSDFETTAKAGTKRLAKAIRSAISSCDELEVKQELAGVALLAKNLAGKSTSIKDFTDHFHLSDTAKSLIKKNVPSKKALTDLFRLNFQEFSKHISYKSLELDSGAIMTAPLDNFDECFKEGENLIGGKRSFTAIGTVVNERLRKSK